MPVPFHRDSRALARGAIPMNWIVAGVAIAAVLGFSFFGFGRPSTSPANPPAVLAIPAIDTPTPAPETTAGQAVPRAQ